MYTTGAYYSGNQFPANLYGSPTNLFNTADGMLNHLKDLSNSVPNTLPMSYSSGGGVSGSSYGYNSGFYGGYGFNGLFAANAIAQTIGMIGSTKERQQTMMQGAMLQNAAAQQQMQYSSQIQAQQGMMDSLKMLMVMKMFTGVMNNSKS
jgi:hypothetical protein